MCYTPIYPTPFRPHPRNVQRRYNPNQKSPRGLIPEDGGCEGVPTVELPLAQVVASDTVIGSSTNNSRTLIEYPSSISRAANKIRTRREVPHERSSFQEKDRQIRARQHPTQTPA
jgi:hypothetical protein